MTKTIDTKKHNWTEIIEPKVHLLDLKLKDLWRYRDLLLMFVKRDFVSAYKQTILGPLWFFIQPVLTTLTYVLIFGQVANLSTDGLPMLPFYLAGVTIWNYFSECLNKTATIFRDNASIFGKVYFPRLIMPLSIITSNLVKLGIQFTIFLAVVLYYTWFEGSIHPNVYLLLTPFLIILMAGISLGFGLIFSSLTTKYRDLVFLLTFGTQLIMYATPVIYPLSVMPPNFGLFLKLNPLSSIFETFRYGWLGNGSFSWEGLLYTTVFMVIILLIGAVIFNKVEKNFMDTV